MAVRKKDLLESIEQRIPFRVAQGLLKEAGFPVSRTWEDTRGKIANGDSKKMNPHALYEAYVRTLVSYDKSVALYKVGHSARDSILKSALSLAPDQNDLLVKRYPYVVDEKALSRYSEAETKLVSIEPLNGVTALVFSTVQIVTQREKIPLSRLPQSISKIFSEIIGIKKIYSHSYDVVILPHAGDYIWLCCDFPAYSRSDHADFSHLSVPKLLNQLMGMVALSKPVNLFPVISKIYGNGAEGLILALSHIPPTGSIKHERWRDGQCLRTELFHEGGLKAVLGKTDPFAIGVTWDASGSEEIAGIELLITGEAKDIGKASPVVDVAIVRKALEVGELQEVLEKVISYL